jgi:hypothetical protein
MTLLKRVDTVQVKDEALDRTVLRTHLGRGCEPVIRERTECMNNKEHTNCMNSSYIIAEIVKLDKDNVVNCA